MHAQPSNHPVGQDAGDGSRDVRSLVLERVLEVQQAIHASSSDEQLRTAVTQGLEAVPGVEACRIQTVARPGDGRASGSRGGWTAFPVGDGGGSSASLLVRLAGDVDPSVAPLLDNTAKLLSLWRARHGPQAEPGGIQDAPAPSGGEATDSGRPLGSLDLVLLGSNLGTWDWDVPSGEVAFNERWAEMLGYELDEIEPHVRAWEHLVHPEDMPRVDAALQAHLEGRSDSYETEHRLRHKSGRWVWVLDKGRVIQRDAEGRPLRVSGTHLDISRRRSVEADRRMVEKRFRSLLEHTSEGFYLVEPTEPISVEAPRQEQIQRLHQAVIVECNDALAHMYGRTRAEELIDRSMDDLHGPWDGEKGPPVLEMCIDQGYQVSGVVSSEVAPSGDTLWFSNSVLGIVEDGRIVRVWGTRTDVTELKRVESMLSQRVAQLVALLESIRQGVVVEDEGRRIAFVNQEACGLLALESPQALIGADGAEATGWMAARFANADAFVEDIERMISEARARPEERLETVDGRVIERSYTPVRAEGRLHGHLWLYRERTEEVRAERDRDRLVQAVEQTGESVVITDPEGRIQYVNAAFEAVTGYSRREALGENPRILKSGEQDESFYQELWETLTRGDTWTGRFVNQRRNGERYIEDAVISPIRDEQGRTTSYVAVKRDITELLEQEAQLRQSGRMEAVGSLAGGIAHDFNNMLSVILGQTEMALLEVGRDDPLLEPLQEIRKAGRRSAALTQQLLAFARKQPIAPEVLDLNRVIPDLLGMLRRLIGEEIRLQWRPGEGSGAVRIDPGQVNQLLVNLCVNARDAIGGPGTIVVETGPATRPERATEQAFVRLSIRDDGPGMDDTTRERVFEPFFTTKAQGEGTGLGLAIVYGIVKQNGGFVEVETEPDVGSTFHLYFPLHGEGSPTRQRREPWVRPRGGGERILLVEDEPAILSVAERMLLGLGYTVVSAQSPVEALSRLDGASEDVDLLLTDVVMPGMTGYQLVERIQERLPGLPIIFMSGYPGDTVAARGIREEDVHFLPKPFVLDDLAAVVRAALE